ncbi:MAG: glutathione S-transferase [Gammaproteobacteria bacterium]|nr:glutathione S-transferase [Gammaproteobacteria bacterium]
MRLRYSPTSPYVRKVMATAIETGQKRAIEKIPTNPWDPESGIDRDNPLGKVPALILDDGSVLFDSPVICAYLDSLHQGRPLIPPSGRERWDVLCLEALADGLMDAAVLVTLEKKHRDEAVRSQWWLDVQKETVDRSIRELDRRAGDLSSTLDLAQIAIGCALGYLDLRMPDRDWRGQAPALDRWYQRFSTRTSMQETVPADPV